MKKHQGNRVGSARCSRLRLSCKKNLNNSKSSLNISNYFVKTKQPVEETVDSQSSPASGACDELEVSNADSPYQNFLTEVQPLLNDSLCDKSDFKTVEPLKCRARKAAATTEKLLNIKAGKAKKSKQVTMVKLMERNFSNGDVNGDHLQMALALSRSMQDLESSCLKEKEEDLSAVCHPVRRGNTILEQFGFNSGRKLGTENKIVAYDAFKKRKKSRYQYITPVLFLRTDEDREKIIATKVSLILSQENKFEVDVPQQRAFSLSSPYLQSLNKSEVHRLNQLTHEELKNKDLFFLSNLKVPQSMCTSGHLLKDWNDIFGREATPPRDVKTINRRQLESNKENELESNKENELESNTENELENEFQSNKGNEFESNKENVPKDERTPPRGFNTEGTTSPRGVQSSLKKDFTPSHHQSDRTNTSVFKSRGSCVSPDLFDSDDDFVVSDLNRSINEQLELSQRLINNFKSKSIFFDKSGSSHADDDCKEKPATRSSFDSSESNEMTKCFEYENQSGIYHFESFQECTDYCTSKRDAAAADLEESNSVLNTCGKQIQNKEFYDLTTDTSDEESLVSYIHMVKLRTESRDPAVLDFGESVLRSSRLEKVSVSDKSDCELEISSTSKESPVTFNTSMNTSHHSSNSNKSESRKKLTQETATARGHLQESISTDLGELSQGSIRISNNYTFVSESDENLSQRGDDKFQAECGSRSLEKFNSFSSASDGNLSDEELNYSSMYTKSIINLESSTSEEEDVEEFCKSTTNNSQNDFKDDIDNFDALTPENNFKKHDDKLIIKTKGITPLPDYTGMDTPRIAKELQKFGIKNLKRRRGVEILHYIYDSTHPLVPERELGSISDGNPVVKRRKGDDVKKSRRKLESKYNEIRGANEQHIELVGDLLLQENETDLIFEKRQSTKVASCRVPLHIAWFNLVARHPEIRESILLYEPLQLEVLYSLLKEQSYKYSVQDLLTFLDKKCITIRTIQNQRKTAQKRIKVSKATTLSS